MNVNLACVAAKWTGVCLVDRAASKGTHIQRVLRPHVILVLASCVHYWCHMYCKIWSLLEPLD